MKNTHNLIGGFAGALVLNVVHETARQFLKKAPRVDIIGKEALNKGLSKANQPILSGRKLYLSTLGADIAGNALYYSLAGVGSDKNLFLRGAALGFAAGLGALTLTEKIGLDDRPVNKTTETKLLTVAWYTIGGIAAAAAIKCLRRYSDK